MMGQDDGVRSIIYGQKSIQYRLIYSARSSLEIAVLADATVIVKAPTGASISKIEQKISKRARWIIKQLNYFKQFSPRTPKRYYLNGETHLYLGRRYRLKSVQAHQDWVKLTRGYFLISCREQANPVATERLMKNWYAEKAALQFNASFDRCWPKFKQFSLDKPTLSIRRMQKRWGSLSPNGRLTLNANLVKTPRECIDYVVTHELCHLIYHNHCSGFYKLLETVIPSWEKVKHKLELSLI
ncbi:MAG: M48 family metallopeptidase [Xanthomonadales bacterium]|nr:M48 family metallopeptidase [Xanthomonadales bacterium]